MSSKFGSALELTPLALTTLAIVMGLAGCGGLFPSTESGGEGRLAVRILWPEETRRLPDAAYSLRLEISRPTDIQHPVEVRILPRHVGTSGTTELFVELPPAPDYRLSVTAHSSPDGTGTVLASHTKPGLVVDAGRSTPWSISLATDAATLEFTSPISTIKQGDSARVSLLVKDSRARAVLVNRDSIQWTVQNESILSVQAVEGHPDQFQITGLSNGTTSIQARERNLGVSTAPITISVTDIGGTMQDLGTFGGSTSIAYGVSADGSVIVGEADTAQNETVRAFRWTTSSGVQDIGTLGGSRSSARAVSADGSVVVGQSGTAQNQVRGFRWTETGGMENIGSLGGVSTLPDGVSANGEVVVGSADMSGVGTRAFRWSRGEGLMALDPFAARAHDASSDGSVIVGYYQNPSSSQNNGAYSWTQGGGFQFLGRLAGTFAIAHGISDDGSVVVGFSEFPVFSARAFRWTATTGMQNLGTLGGNSSAATDISANGLVVVGTSENVLGQIRAFRWTAESGMQELGTLGGGMSEALAVSADGSVIVGVSTNARGQRRAFRWVKD